MKNIAFVLLMVFCLPLSAQEEKGEEDYVLNSAGLTYKGILDTIADESKSFEQKYAAVRLIDYIEPLDKTTDVYQKILQQAKQQVDQQYTLSLSVAIANSYLFGSDTDNAKLYLDSAFTYVNEVDDLGTLGLYYYIKGRYFSMTDNENEMIHSYYKSISYFEQVENRRVTIMMLLYNLGALYHSYEDAPSFKNIVDKSLTLALQINEPTSYIQAYSLAAAYYEIKWKEDSLAVNYDSVIVFQKKIIDVYNNADNLSKEMTQALVVQCYLNLVEVMISHHHADTTTVNDWSEIKGYMKEVQKIMHDNNNTLLIYENIRQHYLNGEIFANEKLYPKAKQSALDCISLLNEQPHDEKVYKQNRCKVYNLLAKVEEQMGNAKSALHYMKLAQPLAIELQNDKKYKAVKELETKYETAKKDLLISQQKEREQQLIFDRTLIFGGLVAVAILLTLAILYNRLLRLRKEKEIANLDKRVKDKDVEYLTLLNEIEDRQTRNYLDGLEAERTRLAKELHDNVANKLYMLDQELKKIEQLPNDIPSRMEDLYSNVRNISHELIPPIFKNATLPEVLHTYIFVMGENTDTAFEVKMENEEVLSTLPQELCLEVYRIVQEAIANILKHAKAKNVLISLSAEDTCLKLAIEDDGQGFDMQKQQKGIGLQIIKNRCESLQGELHISSKIGQGTKLEASFCISQALSDVAELQ